MSLRVSTKIVLEGQYFLKLSASELVTERGAGGPGFQGRPADRAHVLLVEQTLRLPYAEYIPREWL